MSRSRHRRSPSRVDRPLPFAAILREACDEELTGAVRIRGSSAGLEWTPRVSGTPVVVSKASERLADRHPEHGGARVLFMGAAHPFALRIPRNPRRGLPGERELGPSCQRLFGVGGGRAEMCSTDVCNPRFQRSAPTTRVSVPERIGDAQRVHHDAPAPRAESRATRRAVDPRGMRTTLVPSGAPSRTAPRLRACRPPSPLLPPRA